MNSTVRILVEQIVTAAKSCRRSISTIAVIGSSSPLSNERTGHFSDVDVLLLYKDKPETKALLDALDKIVQENQRVLMSWNIVSSAFVGAKVIHLHSASVEAYLEYSSLFRRSAAKYPSLVGHPLSRYAPPNGISQEELIRDRLGVASLLQRVRSLEECMGFGVLVAEPHIATPADVSVYCVLHSIRNTLRWLGKYQEFASSDQLEGMWRAVGGIRPDVVQQFITLKKARRNGDTLSETAEISSVREAREFLSLLCAWISRTSGNGDTLALSSNVRSEFASERITTAKHPNKLWA